jgi:putative colanic acid biosynthesis acetyltransferase WcaF
MNHLDIQRLSPSPPIRSMNTDPRGVARRPYPLWTYAARTLWKLVESTLWRLAWRRLHFLRPSILRLFGARLPLRCLISGSVQVYFPWLLDIGTDVAIADRVVFYNLGGVTVGHRAVISQDVYLCGGTHDYTSPKYPLICKAIAIEDDVWIGAGAFIGPGVRIGRGAVVGARAVVFKDVPSWKVVVGNPARVLKDRVLVEH